MGGHPIFAAQLLSYLTDHEFTYFQRNPDVADFEPLYNPMQANPLNFEGNLFVLVNGKCLSTTGHLISLLKYHTQAKFIGEEPGTSFLCNDFSTQIKLPNPGWKQISRVLLLYQLLRALMTGCPFLWITW